MSTHLPRLQETIEVSPLVEAYSRLSPLEYVGKLAPSLGMIIEHEFFNPQIVVGSEFLDTEAFLSITHLDPMLDILKMINDGLRVVREAPLAVSLTQEMGFGKTHFLTLLWHLYAKTYSWETQALKSLNVRFDKIKQTGYNRKVAEKTLVLAIDLQRIPPTLKPYEAIFETAAKILEGKKRIHGIEAVDPDFVRNLKRLRPLEAANALVDELSRFGEPVLVFIDELYSGIISIAEGGSPERIRSMIDLVTFLKQLIETSRGRIPLVFIYASAEEDVNRWSKMSEKLPEICPDAETRTVTELLVEAVNELNDRVKRLKPGVLRALSTEDVVNILILRLLKFKVLKSDIIPAMCKAIREYFTGFIGEEEVENLVRRLTLFYPFSPSYEFLIFKFIHPTFGADLPESQHIRDLLKITASVISRIQKTKWNECSLIGIAHIKPEDFVHTMKAPILKEWIRIYNTCELVSRKIPDEIVKDLTLSMLSIVYTKSITTNIPKLLDMIRAPKIQPRREMEFRGTTKRAIAAMLIGAIPEEYFEKFNEAFEVFSKRMPYVDSIEYEGEDYYIVSQIPSAPELVEQIRDEERKKAGLEEKDYQKMLEYFKDHIQTQYSLIGSFEKKSAEKAPPKLHLIDWKHIMGLEGKPKFLDLLDRNNFTILTVSPWSVLEESLVRKKTIDFVEATKSIIEKFRNDIPYINMFAIVIPEISPKSLEQLCDHIATVNAASTVIEYIVPKELELYKHRRLQLLRRIPTVSTLKDFYRTDEEFEKVLIDILEVKHKKIESYCASQSASAIKDYTSKLISLFTTVVYFDPEKGSITHAKLAVTPSEVREFSKIYGELPTWILNAVKSKCRIKSHSDIRASLVSYIKSYVEKHKPELLAGKTLEIDGSYLIEAIMKGWSEIPVKPISKAETEHAISLLGGQYAVVDPQINMIRVLVKDLRILVERVRPPPLSLPPTGYNIVEIRGVNNVAIGLLELNRLSSSLGIIAVDLDLDLDLKTRMGKISISQISVDIANTLKVSEVLTQFKDSVRAAVLKIHLEERRNENEILKSLRSVGINELMVTLRRSGS